VAVVTAVVIAAFTADAALSLEMLLAPLAYAVWLGEQQLHIQPLLAVCEPDGRSPLDCS